MVRSLQNFRATRAQNYLKRSLWGATWSAKAAAYTSLVHPTLEYACTVWSPHTSKDQLILERVQQWAAWWAYGSHWNPTIRKWSKSFVEFTAELTWPVLSTHHNYLSLCLLYDIINKHQSLPLPGLIICQPEATHSVYSSIAFNCQLLSIFVFCHIIILWNSIPHSILSLSHTVFCQTLYRYLCN